MGKPTDLVQGTLDLLILKTVALQPMHGWGIAQRIKQVSKEVLQVNQGALYPALHRLEQQGWIQSKWGESENNRRAKYYSLTRDGAKCLRQQQAQWSRLSLAIDLANHGATALHINSVSIVGTNASDFLISFDSCPPDLVANAGCTVSVEFHPTAVGTRTASLAFSDNGGASPQLVRLTGTGQ